MPTNYSPSTKPMLKQIYILAAIFVGYFVVAYFVGRLFMEILGIQ
jgi:hypothetical protein